MPKRPRRCALPAPSDTWWKFVALLALLAITLPANAQSYSIDWHKMATGGGTSTGGLYAVRGAIGQPDVGAAMSGGSYSLTGAFWSLVYLVQTPGAPLLTATRSGNSVIVSWPYPSSGFNLQQNDNLGSTNWTASGFTISTNGSVNSITITAPTGRLFFRLRTP